jgi:alpha-L-arabinofuranosidase
MVFPDKVGESIWPEVIGINLNPGGRVASIARPETQEMVRRVGIRSIRFPNGCVADRYNWKAADGRKQISVEQFLDFCEAIDAEPYYTLNLQGGTENLEGPFPEGATLSERVRYRHTAPNPCGWTDYHFGTLAEALEFVQRYTIERARERRLAITCYEMGNENWGQATTDWWPELYAATVAEYAKAIRGLVAKAAGEDSALAELRLHITTVGYPLVGNNQDPLQATNREINVRWTKEMNALFEQGLIDAVQDHMYPYNATASDLLVWSEHNMQNILLARLGERNPRLGGYLDPALAYATPIEITEWNLKCWGDPPHRDIPAENLDFEMGLTGWEILQGDAAGRVLATDQGRRGTGIRIETGGTADGAVGVRQEFSIGNDKAKHFSAAVWVRTDRPEKVSIQVLGRSEEDEAYHEVFGETGRRTARRRGYWHRISAGGRIPEGVSQWQVVVSAEGPAVKADIDGVQLAYWVAEGGLAPTAVDTAAQQLFLVDAYRVMIEHGVRRSHLHHLFGQYPCGVMLPDGEAKENFKAFEFLAGRIGKETVQARVTCERFEYACPVDQHASDFNALVPDVKDVPVISAIGMRDEGYVYVLAVNRTTDVPVDAEVKLEGRRITGPIDVRSLTCEDFDVPGVHLEDRQLTAGAEMRVRLEPHAAYVLRFPMGRRGN